MSIQIAILLFLIVFTNLCALNALRGLGREIKRYRNALQSIKVTALTYVHESGASPEHIKQHCIQVILARAKDALGEEQD